MERTRLHRLTWASPFPAAWLSYDYRKFLRFYLIQCGPVRPDDTQLSTLSECSHHPRSVLGSACICTIRRELAYRHYHHGSVHGASRDVYRQFVRIFEFVTPLLRSCPNTQYRDVRGRPVWLTTEDSCVEIHGYPLTLDKK